MARVTAVTATRLWRSRAITSLQICGGMGSPPWRRCPRSSVQPDTMPVALPPRYWEEAHDFPHS
jgi:hypothetical protein